MDIKIEKKKKKKKKNRGKEQMKPVRFFLVSYVQNLGSKTKKIKSR